MTINKSQGQSLNTVGIDLRVPVFCHGQLYVALSRVTDVAKMTVLLPEDNGNKTVNIVYPEVLGSVSATAPGVGSRTIPVAVVEEPQFGEIVEFPGVVEDDEFGSDVEFY